MIRSFAIALALSLLPSFALFAQNEIEGLRVETYYVSDVNDATDATGGTLVAGSKTYRVFVDLGEGCSLLAMYGDTNHVFSIASTAPFFNNTDRGKTYGHEIADNRLDENTVALDSWLALGRASNLRFGVEEADDTDGSIIGGANNDGGSASISGGLLVNADPSAGAPLTEKDGLMPLNGAPVVPSGFFLVGDDPVTVFSDVTSGASFVSEDFNLGCTSPGVSGPTSDNVVLLAQLTTSGDLAFDLNLLIQRPDGSLARFVANDSLLLPGEQVYSLLHYPPECGCTDTDYLEFDPAAGCDDGSCATLIVFGCMDTEACNYDPDANFSVPQLCCYGPADCNGLDVSVVCPGVGLEEIAGGAVSVTIAPNPTDGPVDLIITTPTRMALRYTILDATGRVVSQAALGVAAGSVRRSLDLEDLSTGAYRIRVEGDGVVITRILIKG